MKIQKKLINEAVGITSQSKKTFSGKKQNIILTEEQIESLLKHLKK
jgi:hypothetical protein